MNNIENKYKPFPFWSWNDELDEKELVRQIDWMYENGIGGFFMHARGGLTTPYLGEKWFSCVEACLKRAKELNMEGYAYDENGWPSGFVGGKLLEDEDNHDRYLTYSIGKVDPNAFVSYNIDGDKLVRTTEGDNVLNVYMHIATSTADICNKEVVDKFIAMTHEQYKKHDKYGNLKGFFTDEPQYFRWNTSYTRVLPDYFKKTYGEDIFDRLGLLFVEKEGYRDFRYKYWKSMQTLMLTNFAKNVYDWCVKNNYKLTGHYVEETRLGFQIACCGGIMPFYEYEHIPGCDWLGRNIGANDLGPKQVGSVSAQLGKKQTMTELFACVGWDTTPLELKHIGEFLFVNGVNIICHHLLPYSEHGQRKRDYPEHYSAINPWVNKHFLEFNDYFSSLGKTLSESKEVVNVGILNPLTSCYFDYKRNEPAYNVSNIDNGFSSDLNLLAENHIPYHIIDEVILAKHGSVDKNQLVVGLAKYKYLILPSEIITMDSSTEKLLEEYIKNGGKVLILKNVPSYLEGNPYSYDYLKSNCSIDEIAKDLDFLMEKNINLRLSYHEDEKGHKFIYIVNLSKERQETTITVKGYSSFECNGKGISPQLIFDGYESKVLYFSNKEIEKVNELKPLYLNDKYVIEGHPINYLTLDTLSYSLDEGKTYSPKMNCMGAFNELLQKRHKGIVYLKYNFMVEDIPSSIELLAEDLHNKEVLINGKRVNKVGTVLEKDLWKYDVNGSIKKGDNEIIIKIDYYQGENVYYALFGENVTESLKNCLAYDTTIEAIYLRGDFGVSGDFKQGENPMCYLANEFKITKQNKEVSDLILDGFPFFRGDITISQIIEVDDTLRYLEFVNRFQTIDLYINEQYVGNMMFTNKIDVSKYLVKGKNKVTIKGSISNRNCLGPFHSHNEEEVALGPYTWERMDGGWKDGKNRAYVDRYSFVKSLVYKK